MQSLDYLCVLQAVKELPFSVGKQTLVDLLRGAVTQKMVTNGTYMDLKAYGALKEFSERDIRSWVDRLVREGCLKVSSPADKPYYKLLELTAKGQKELQSPSLKDKRYSAEFSADQPEEQSAALIKAFFEHLKQYNAEQQHAIVCPKERVLCVAGAGTGKTTVLTKRAEFLCRFRGADPKRVLCITFTRKARAEMKERLGSLPVVVSTFNGFCQRLLKKHDKALPIVSFGDKMRLFRQACEQEGIVVGALVQDYFTVGQRKMKTSEELQRKLMKDVFGLLDHYANEGAPLPTQYPDALASTLLTIARAVQGLMNERGVSDYSGQLNNALQLLRENPAAIPRYEHVLVDEYQDVNSAQQQLLSLLAPKNLFVVGDPRQSIFGWRGSRLEYITGFEAQTTVQLKINYRSDNRIIELANQVIKPLGLPDLKGASGHAGAFQELSYDSEDDERLGIAALLKGADGDAFVLARTNQQLDELSALLARSGIEHSVRGEESEEEPSGLVLSTVHAIKGLEADRVVVMGCSERYFPCKVSDHPVMELVKDFSFDREEEERRLLYVALTRAKHQLLVTYSGQRSHFLDAASSDPSQRRLPVRDDGLFEALKAWRAKTAKKKGLPAYRVLTDKALRHLTEKRPLSAQELFDVQGIGDVKAKLYGDDLLEILKP
jgi:superfamily I DNA/RNA helicase